MPRYQGESTPIWHSPLNFLEDFLYENNIPCFNIELRNPCNEAASEAAIDFVEKNTDSYAIAFLESIYKNCNIKDIHNDIAIDAHIINKIRDLNQQIIIVVAGGSHN